MKKVLLVLSLIMPWHCVAENFFQRDFTLTDERVHQSHNTFVIDMGVLIYESLHEFAGQNKQITPDSSLVYMGGGINIGRNIKLAGGWWTSSEAGLFLYQRLDRHDMRAKEDIDYDVSVTKEDHRLQGVRLAQSLKYRFRYKKMMLEPLIQVSLSYGQMRSETNYYYDDTLVENFESYNASIREDIYMINYAVGLNFLWESGVSLAVKAQSNAITIGDRRSEISTQVGSSAANTIIESEGINTTRNDLALGLSAGFIF